MASPALIDLLTPYVLEGAAMSGLVHELLSVLWVQRLDTALDDDGVVVSGVARFTPEAQINPPIFTPPASISMSGTASVEHREDRGPGAYWDFPDIDIRFRLTVPRTSSPVIDAALPAVPIGPLLTGWGTGTAARGDAPGTSFTLDLLFDVATLHLPFLRAARLKPDGMLEADPASPPVKLRLPKIKISVTQTAGAVTPAPLDPEVQVRLDSWAASDIDDPAGTAYAELLRMEPPYALIGPGEALGFGFDSVILDLSGDVTPPELLDKFGVGEDFRGIYLPDARVFFVLGSSSTFGFDISARELLVGIGPEGGVSGIFGLDIVHPASAQEATVSIYDDRGALLHQARIDKNPVTAPIEVVVPHHTKWIVDVTGGNPPYNITVDGQVQTTAAIDVTIPAGATDKTVVVTVADVHVGGQSRSLTFHLTLTAPSASAGVPAATTKDAELTVVTAGPPGFLITMVDDARTEQLQLRFTPPNPTTVTITPQGQPAQTVTPTSGMLTRPLAHGTSIDVTATWPSTGTTTPETVTTVAYFRYAQPAEGSMTGPADSRATAFGNDVDNMHRSPSRDEPRPADDWTVPGDVFEAPAGAPFAHPAEDGVELHAWLDRLAANPTAPVELRGTASRERQPNVAYNLALSQRRIWAIRALLERRNVNNPLSEAPQGEVGTNAAGRGANRKVTLSFQAAPTPGTTPTSTVRIIRPPRPAVPPAVIRTVNVREPVGPPDVQFRELHIRVQIDHNRVIAIEAKLKIDVKTVLENKLASTRAGHPGSATGAGATGSTALPVGTRGGNPADPDDGVIDIRVLLTLDDTVGRWTAIASMFENDRDGFLQTPHPASSAAPTDEEAFWRTYFGVLLALAPLLDATASSNTDAGTVTALAIGVGVPFLAASTDVVSVPRITMYGGELIISHDTDGTVMALLLDVEVALIVKLEIGGATLIDTQPDNPITVRYKAVGFKTSDEPQLRDIVPVFDSSKGYEISVPSTGGIRVPAPLGDILQVAGTRIVRSNPVNLELDLTLKADLGVVSVDKTTVRIPLDGSGGPTITALGVHLDVPGAVEGHGYLAIYPDGFAGQIDASMPGLGVRIAAGLSVRNVQDPSVPGRSATAVMVTLEVDFPVPIALGNSGLGIYGFGGLFALHFRRDERPTDPVPALDWLQRVNGNRWTSLVGCRRSTAGRSGSAPCSARWTPASRST